MEYIRKLAANRGNVLFVGTKRQAREILAEEAQRAGMPYVDERWLGGMLTNFKTVKQSIKRLKGNGSDGRGWLDGRLSKKEALMASREMEKLQKSIGGIKDMGGLPDALFVIDVGYHKIAVTEAKKLGIPVVAVVDTNHSPEGLDYVIRATTTPAAQSACTPVAICRCGAGWSQPGGAGNRRGRRRRVRRGRRRRAEGAGLSGGEHSSRCAPTKDLAGTSMAEITASMVKELRENRRADDGMQEGPHRSGR